MNSPSASENTDSPPSRGMIYLAFASLYLIWGSTYLAIRIGIETLPPFFMAGCRFLISGSLLYFWARKRGAPSPTAIQWRSTFIVGAFLLLGGNGGVVWAEQRLPSSIAAVVIATVPFWMVLLEWLFQEGPRPTLLLALGLVLGFAGVVVLLSPSRSLKGQPLDSIGTAVLLFSAFSWACGSIYARRARLPSSPFLTTAMEMFAGGFLLLLAGVLTGEIHRFEAATFSLRSILALAYLIFFGSFLGFTAYIWLLKVTTPAQASTYAFVNPVVAVLLGCLFAGEKFSFQSAVASAIIVIGVIFMIFDQVLRTPRSIRERKHSEEIHAEA